RQRDAVLARQPERRLAAGEGAVLADEDRVRIARPTAREEEDQAQGPREECHRGRDATIIINSEGAAPAGATSSRGHGGAARVRELVRGAERGHLVALGQRRVVKTVLRK